MSFIITKQRQIAVRRCEITSDSDGSFKTFHGILIALFVIIEISEIIRRAEIVFIFSHRKL